MASIFMRSGPQLEAILGPKLGPSRPIKSPRSRPGRLPIRAWGPDSTQIQPRFQKLSPSPPRWSPRCHFASILASLFGPFLLPIPSKTSSKNFQKTYTIFASIFQRFSMDLGPHFRAKLAHLGTKLAIKAPLEALLGALGRLFGSKMLPKRPPEAPRPPRPPSSSIFGPFWEGFRSIFWWFFEAPGLLEQCFNKENVVWVVIDCWL